MVLEPNSLVAQNYLNYPQTHTFFVEVWPVFKSPLPPVTLEIKGSSVNYILPELLGGIDLSNSL